MWDDNYAKSLSGDFGFSTPQTNVKQREPICSPLTPYDLDCEGNQLPQSDTKDPVKTGLENIAPERLEQIKDYARKLHKKYPHMSEARVRRKTAEYFKIKLT
jgi:hypothetical protein